MEEKFLHLAKEEATTLLETIPPMENIQYLGDFFKVFGDATRLRILYALSQGEMCVYDLSTLLGISQSATSHQLKILRDNRLVRSRRDGKTIFYGLSDHHISMIMNQGLEHIQE